MINAAISTVIDWANSTFTPDQIYFLGLGFIWFPYYWAVSGFFLYLDYYQPAWAQPYRLQAKKNKFDFQQFKSAIPLILFNSFVVGNAVARFILAPHQLSKPGFFDPDLFSLFDLIKWAVLCFVFEDVLFYTIHRICHENKFLYQNVHKIHHEWQTPCAAVATYAHPLEHLFVNVFPATIGLYLFSGHFMFDFMWNFMACTNTLLTHCGYHFPGMLIFPERHDFHHERFQEMYGVGMMDMIFGPSIFFSKSIHAITETFYLRPSWFKNTRDSWRQKKTRKEH